MNQPDPNSPSSWPPIFVLGSKIDFDENDKIEFKAVTSNNPVQTITKTAEDYIVAFLNGSGGRIVWGISDDHTVLGIQLDGRQRDDVRKGIADKVHGIRPAVDPSRYVLEFHPVHGDEATVSKSLCIVEVAIEQVLAADPYFNHADEAFVRLNGVKQKLAGPKLVAWIKSRLPRLSSPLGTMDDPKLKRLVQRIRLIFEKHGLEPTHIPRFLEIRNASFSIKLTDLETDTALLRWIDEQKIDWLSKTFLVRREWIDGEDDSFHEHFHFDKQPEHFFSTISQHADALVYSKVHDLPYAYFIRWGVGTDWKRKNDSRVFVVVAVPLARFSNERTAYKYISDFNPVPWARGRGKIQLRAWARLLYVSKGIHCFGKSVPDSVGQKLWSNRGFLYDIIENQLSHERDWHPEDYALYPNESVVAKETENLPDVIDFLRENNLPWEKTRLDQ